jgi:hypothetical protein
MFDHVGRWFKDLSVTYGLGILAKGAFCGKGAAEHDWVDLQEEEICKSEATRT